MSRHKQPGELEQVKASSAANRKKKAQQKQKLRTMRRQLAQLCELDASPFATSSHKTERLPCRRKSGPATLASEFRRKRDSYLGPRVATPSEHLLCRRSLGKKMSSSRPSDTEADDEKIPAKIAREETTEEEEVNRVDSPGATTSPPSPEPAVEEDVDYENDFEATTSLPLAKPTEEEDVNYEEDFDDDGPDDGLWSSEEGS